MLVDMHRVGIVGRIVQLASVPSVIGACRRPRRGGDEVEVELALQPLLDDLEMQQAEEPAAEAEAQRRAGLGLEMERGVVERSLASDSRRVSNSAASAGTGRRTPPAPRA
jgi:hypothetical protein